MCPPHNRKFPNTASVDLSFLSARSCSLKTLKQDNPFCLTLSLYLIKIAVDSLCLSLSRSRLKGPCRVNHRQVFFYSLVNKCHWSVIKVLTDKIKQRFSCDWEVLTFLKFWKTNKGFIKTLCCSIKKLENTLVRISRMLHRLSEFTHKCQKL